MLDIMTQAENAIEAYNQALQASSANIANMNVSGYKRINVSFQSVFEKVLSRGSAATTSSGGTNPIQFGQGMAVSQTGIDFSNLSITGEIITLRGDADSEENLFAYIRELTDSGRFTQITITNIALTGDGTIDKSISYTLSCLLKEERK